MRTLFLASMLIASAVRADEAVPNGDVWTNGKLAEAAKLVRPAFVTRLAIIPDLERQRLKETAAADLKVDNTIEGGSKTQITPLGDSHYRVHMAQDAYPNWFILRVTNVPPGGKTVRFDLDNSNVHKLCTANPVYAPLRDLAEPDAYLPADGTDSRTAVATSGAAYPTAAGLAWKFIPDVWRSSPTDLSFVHRFDRDTVVALRVPYGTGYHATFVKSLEGLANTTVHTVGNGATVIEIGSADEAKRKANPHVVAYSREDGCQQDGSWFIEGMAQFLISDAPEAVAAREQCTFLLLPIVDPGAAENLKWANDGLSFDNNNAVVNPLVDGYRVFLRQLAGENRKVAAVFDLFAPESSEFSTMHYQRVKRDQDDQAICGKLQAAFDETGIYHFVGPVGTNTTFLDDRLIGEVGRIFSAQQFMFFVNSQDPQRHLSLDELRQMGGLFTQTVAEHYAKATGQANGHGDAGKDGHP